MAETTELACPECGGLSFNWIVRQVQRGPMLEFSNGHRNGEGYEMGEIVDSDIYKEGVFCEGCDKMMDVEDLVAVE